MTRYDIERLEAILLSLRDQVDVLGDRLDALRSEQERQFSRLQAVVRALRTQGHAQSVGRPTYPTSRGAKLGSSPESLAQG